MFWLYDNRSIRAIMPFLHCVKPASSLEPWAPLFRVLPGVLCPRCHLHLYMLIRQVSMSQDPSGTLILSSARVMASAPDYHGFTLPVHR